MWHKLFTSDVGLSGPMRTVLVTILTDTLNTYRLSLSILTDTLNLCKMAIDLPYREKNEKQKKATQ